MLSKRKNRCLLLFPWKTSLLGPRWAPFQVTGSEILIPFSCPPWPGALYWLHHSSLPHLPPGPDLASPSAVGHQAVKSGFFLPVTWQGSTFRRAPRGPVRHELVLHPYWQLLATHTFRSTLETCPNSVCISLVSPLWRWLCCWRGRGLPSQRWSDPAHTVCSGLIFWVLIKGTFELKCDYVQPHSHLLCLCFRASGVLLFHFEMTPFLFPLWPVRSLKFPSSPQCSEFQACQDELCSEGFPLLLREA